MLGNIKHVSSDRWSSGSKDHNFCNRGKGIKHVVGNMPQTRWKCQSCKQNKPDKLSNFAVNANHAIEEQSKSQSCFESKDGQRILFV